MAGPDRRNCFTLNKTQRTIRVEELDKNLAHAVMEAGGKNLRYCFQCGTCSASCPIFSQSADYAPLYLMRLAALGEKQVLKDPQIWMCAGCQSCTERCPRGVRPTDVIRVLRNLAAKEGNINEFYRMQASTIANDGRIWNDIEFINEVRQDMGLPKISPVNLTEVSAILDCTKVKTTLSNKKDEKK